MVSQIMAQCDHERLGDAPVPNGRSETSGAYYQSRTSTTAMWSLLLHQTAVTGDHLIFMDQARLLDMR
jgi:hypothetical protein